MEFTNACLSPTEEGEEYRNCLELPSDVTVSILKKLGPVEILKTSQFVCKSWYNLCKDPAMWRTIDMENVGEREYYAVWYRMWYAAIDRSSGGLIDIHIPCFLNDDIFMYMADRSGGLKCLRLSCCCGISPDGFLANINKLPLLEEVELNLSHFSDKEIIAIGRNCPLLKIFKLNQRVARDPNYAADEEALAIAETMPHLHHLQLIGNRLTNKGLESILDSCRYLESLDLCACFHVHLAGNLRKRCVEHVKELRWPDDPIDDYKYLAFMEEQDCYDVWLPSDNDSADYDYYGDMFAHMLSDDEYYDVSDESEYEAIFDYD